MKKEIITMNEAIKRIEYYNIFDSYKPITLIKKVVGYSLIGIGIVTLPLPTGSVFAIMGGCFIVGIDYKKLLNTINFYGKEVLGFLYRNRSLKLIKYNIKNWRLSHGY